MTAELITQLRSGRLFRRSSFIEPCREVLQRSVASLEDRISDLPVEFVCELVGAAFGFDVSDGVIVSATNDLSRNDIARCIGAIATPKSFQLRGG
jgi:hypothetical protein